MDKKKADGSYKGYLGKLAQGLPAVVPRTTENSRKRVAEARANNSVIDDDNGPTQKRFSTSFENIDGSGLTPSNSQLVSTSLAGKACYTIMD